MPPFRVAVRNQDRAHPNYAWFAFGRVHDSVEEAQEVLPAAQGYYPADEGYLHRVEELHTKDDSGTWKEVR